MSFKPLDLKKALRDPHCRYLVFAANAEHCAAQGFKLLHKVAEDIPVYVVRINKRGSLYLIRQVSIREIKPSNLLAGITSYAAAFQLDGLTNVLVVGTGPLPELERPNRNKDLTQYQDFAPTPLPKHRKRRSRR